MRVIAGEKKRHILQVPRGGTSRPTADRVKESVFAIISGSLADAQVLDLFAGSGSLAIEALSRGAGRAVLVDNHPQALACIRKNLEKTSLTHRARVLGMPVKRALHLLATEKRIFDLVFMDPPYEKGLVAPTLQGLVKHPLLSLNALVVVEHTFKEEVPTAIANLPCIREEAYGDTIVTFLRSCSEH
ncbi:MAG: 16S rRNA (guanine(966)-N(2))-methyltransferase RsmD [Limnochordia bacterium]